MPKLVIKQQLPPPTAQDKFAQALQNILPVLLVIIGIATAASLYLIRDAETAPAVESPNLQLPPVYTRQQERLNQLGEAFEQLSTAAESYDKHQQLVTRSEEIMQQLAEMDHIVDDLSLSEEDKQILLSRHQYQKDYWESKLVFHRLRLARFKVNNPATTQDALREAVGSALEARQVETVVSPTTTTPAVADTRVKEQPVVTKPDLQNTPTTPPLIDGQQPVAAQPLLLEQEQIDTATQPAPEESGLPPGVELPPGVCPLFGPGAAACKPGAENKH